MSRLKTLKSDRDFKHLFRHGRKLENDWLKLWFTDSNLSSSRFVFSVPVLVDKRSTVRNRLKRRAKEWVRKNLKDKTPKDFLIYFKKDVLKLTREQFYEELDKIFKKIYN